MCARTRIAGPASYPPLPGDLERVMTLDDEQRRARARAMVLEAREAEAAGDWARVHVLYAAGYHLMSGHLGLALHAGRAAMEHEDCDRAAEFLEAVILNSPRRRGGAALCLEAKELLAACGVDDARSCTPGS